MNQNELRTFIDTVSDLTSVKRFHGHTIINPQSVADHSCRVAMLAFMLAREYYNDDVAAYKVATFALFHDFTEGILKNDANSAIKSKYGIRELLKKLEHDVVSDLFFSGSDISNSVKDLVLENCDTDIDYQLLKMADTLDFGLVVWHEVGLGNQHIRHLLIAFEQEYNKYPDVIKELSVAIQTKAKILCPMR